MTSRSGPAIGLFGGSFNPAHPGHRHVADAGLRELALDQVWWMVSPQNPLKPTQPPAKQRAKTIERLDLPYAMRISHIETDLGTRYTSELIAELKERYPRHRFILMMGSDNLSQLPKWKRWRRIVASVPIAVIARPSDPIRSRLGLAARVLSPYRVPESQAHSLKDRTPPCWTYLTLPLSPFSSSEIRADSSRAQDVELAR
ncbi:MAG: nicotinate-nucleotide adenylyltransferase [Litorimonas sp.]